MDCICRGLHAILLASGDTLIGYVFEFEKDGPVLVRLDPATGAVRWQYRAPYGEYSPNTPTATAGGRIHVALESSLVTLDRGSGRVLAARQWPKGSCSWLRASAGRVYADQGAGFEAVDAVSGQLLWQQEVSPVAAPAGADDQRLYLIEQGQCSACDATTGWPIWDIKLPDVDPGRDFAPTAALLGNTLYLGLARSGWTSTELLMSAYATDSGKERWTLPLDGLDGTNDHLTNPVAANNTVYFGTRSAKIYAISNQQPHI